MTLAPEHPNCALQEVAVRFSPGGTPMALRHDGGIWMVDPDIHADHWFTQDAAGDTPREHAGDTPREHWQVQAKLPTAGAELRTFTLRREPLDAAWRLESIS